MRLLGALAIVATATVLSAANQAPRAGETEIQVPFFEADSLQVSDGIVAGLFSSLMDQRSLYAVRLRDRAVLARIDDVGRASFALGRHAIVFAPESGARVVRVEFDAGRVSELWSDPADRVTGPIYASETLVRFVVESSGSLRAVQLDPAARAVVLSAAHPAPSERFEVFQSETSTFVLVPETNTGVWWGPNETWQSIDVPSDVRIVALARERLIGLRIGATDVLVSGALSASQPVEWTTIYASAGHIAPTTVRLDPEARLTFLEQSPETVLIWLTADASTPPERLPWPTAIEWRDQVPFAWSSTELASPVRRDGRLMLATAPLASASTAERPTTERSAPTSVQDPAQLGLQWLESQLSAEFRLPDGRAARLIDSYENQERAGWIYDAAVASIAFAAAGDAGHAAALLAGLEHLQDASGSWMFSYDPDAAVPRGTARFVGSIAWVVMAANFYESETSDRQFAPMARRALTYLETFRNTDPSSPLYGTFSMGPGRLHVVSTENNVDCYSAFLWRGRLEDSERDESVAREIREAILQQLWTRPTPSSATGFFMVGPNTSSVYLDVQTWTTLAFGEPSNPVFDQALETAERALTVVDGYLGDVRDIVGLDESTETTDGHTVWVEGTEGMAAALIGAGRPDRADRFLNETVRYQSANGGVPYATANGRDWPTVPSVAATAWFVLNRLSPPRNPFVPAAPPSKRVPERR